MLARSLLAITVFVGMSSLAAGSNWYVSPTALSSGNGSISNPWTLQTALNQPPGVVAGDVIWLREGTYKGTFVSNLNGLVNAPITVRSYPGEWAVIDRNSTGLFPQTLQILGSWTWFWGIEITNSNTVRTILTTGSNPTDGRAEAVVINGAQHIKLINMVIHDSGNGVNDNSGGFDTEVYGSLVFHNGWRGPDRGHGHGIYGQNQSGKKFITDNILFSGYNHGIQVYGSSAASLNGFDIEGNIAFNSGMLQGYFERNFLVGGGGPCDQPIIANNYSYYKELPVLGPGQALAVGYQAGCNNAIIRDNYMAGAILFVNNRNLTMTGNTFATAIQMISNTPSDNFAAYAGNTLFPYPTRPTGVSVLVRPNRYEPGRGHIGIFNWAGQSSVNVNLSEVLSPGAAYEIRDAQNPFASPLLTGVYSGGTVAIPMTGTTMIPPVGVTPPYFHTTSEFGAFIVMPPGVFPNSTAPAVAAPLISPNGASSTGSVTVSLSTSTSGASIFYTTNGDLPTAGSLPYSTSFTLSSSATVKAIAVKAGTPSAVASATFNIDTIPPVRANGAPSGVVTTGTSGTILSLSTNETATCAYSVSDVAFGNMTVFGTTGALAHSTNVTGLTNGGSYTYYVRCRDSLGNINPDSFPISFSVSSSSTVVPLPGLKLWLRADAGVVLNGTTTPLWTDQSPSGTSAVQPVATSQPTFVPGAVNGKPVLRFDGKGRFMTFKLAPNGLSGMTMILVTANTPDLDGDWFGVLNAPLFWNESTGWGSIHLSPFKRFVKYRFGTTQPDNLPIYSRPAPIGGGVTLSTAIKNGTSESLYVNGALAQTQTGKLATINGITDTGNVGRGYNDDTYFTGDIAEVLVYNRALSDAERQQAEQYLLSKYVTVDSAPPVRSNGAPSGTLATGATTATLSLSTDESATCAYSTADLTYASMTAFTNTSGLAHSTNVSGLTNGPYTYYVRCRDTLGNTNPDSFLISFSITASTAIVTTPVIGPNGGTSNTPVNVVLSTATSGASIYYTTNGNPPTAASALYVAPFTLNSSATVKALAVRTGMTDSAVASATFNIDSAPPVRSNGAPAGILAGVTSATLSLSTDETATCAYSPTDLPYASMTAFSATNALTHSTNVTGLTNGGSYTYYVRCRDSLGNINPDSLLIAFSVSSSSTVVPLSGLQLWLRADAGVVLNGTTAPLWTDQSPGGNSAVQPLATSQPTFVPNAINSKPVVRFDGKGRFMTFDVPANGLTGMTLILVTANTPDVDGDWFGVLNAPLFWNESTSWGSIHLSPFQRFVKYRFGTTQADNLPIYTRPTPIGSAVTLSTAIKNGTSESLYVNGALALAQTGKLATITGIRDTGSLGRGYNDDTYFTGDIAEVLVYDRALSDAERQQAEQYLLTKYTSVDSTPPVRSNGAPAGTLAGTTSATLSLSTDESATCAYATADIAYASMTAFSATNALVHSTNVAGLANGGPYTYYVRCRDALGNTNPDAFLISFSITSGTAIVATPVIGPNGGSTNAPMNVILSTATAGASIYYTTNNTTPTAGSTRYTGQFTLNSSATVKALAIKSGMGDSAVASASFVIDSTPPVRSNAAPGGTLASGTTSTTLSLSTDQSATCAYSTSDVAYGSMSPFSATNAMTHSTSVTGLASGTSYTYYVRCRDSLGNTNLDSFLISFGVASALPGSSDWYQSAWRYRKGITIDHARVAGTLSAFPVLISVVDTDLKNQALPNGNDILFTSGDGTTKLNHEIESFDSTTGALTAWVNVPSLNSITDTNLFLYFGNPAAATQANPPAVWDGDFKGVWHLKEIPTGTAPQMRDSTVNGNHGVAGSMTAADQAPGIIGGSLGFSGTRNVSIPDAPSLDNSPAITLSTWIRTSATGLNLNVISKITGCVNSSGFMVWLNENGKAGGMPSLWVGNSGWTDATGVNLANGAWHQITATNTGAISSVYVDGILKASAAKGGTLNTNRPLTLGSSVCGNYLNGRLDEVRVSGAARSAAWIATEYANGSSPGAFSQISTLETAPF